MFIRRRFVVVLAALAMCLALGQSAPAANAAHTYGGYIISSSFLGTRAAIRENGTWSTSAAQCIISTVTLASALGSKRACTGASTGSPSTVHAEGAPLATRR